jgi:branched-chain amino acid transport system ATP-binding protein
LLVLEDLHAAYDSVEALRGASIKVEDHEIVGVLGSSGAGKTTLLGAIAGVVKVTRGEIRFDGESLLGLSPEEIVRKGIGLVPEGRRIFPGLTVAENLRIGAAARSDRIGIQKDIDEMCQRFPILGERLNSSAAKLSGGEQQQLAIARTLMSRPRLLMLDEPSLGLAPLLVLGVFDLIVRLREEMAVTILLVEQNVAKSLDVVDRGYVLRTGAIVGEGRAEELGRVVDIKGAYLGTAGEDEGGGNRGLV